VERFNLKKLSDLEVRKQYQIKISKKFEALENLYDSEDMITSSKALNRITKSRLKRS
jgi:hypothetical protein